ncbi:MAG: gamma-glutamyl-gamma-aminobutyrate hydrolase family protein [Ornithinimicrobium sp.]|uniref:gamma-glutamyl-gamma-aminobutyrate hydrolase family protein n=1 Tax=Ornithinimicrobium sp. TaxID=1977084 RepID=UPI003D9BE485
MTRPRVGLSTYYKEAAWGDWRRPAALVPATYVEAVVRAGGTPLLLPPVGSDSSVLQALDALVLIGGSDLDPARYGQDPHSATRPEPYRDDYELALVHAALARGMPLLAICRGAQVLNVALGGTLHQHVPDVLPGLTCAAGGTAYQPGPGRFGEVSVRTEPGSRIAAALGEQATVPCYHHQAVDEVAPGLVVTARSPDGLVQALEPQDRGPVAPWVLGVQSHPEEDPGDGRLFDALIRAVLHSTTRTAPDRPQEAHVR